MYGARRQPSMRVWNVAFVIVAAGVLALAVTGMLATFCGDSLDGCFANGNPVPAAPLPTPDRASQRQQAGSAAVVQPPQAQPQAGGVVMAQPAGATAVDEQGGVIVDLVVVPPTAVPSATGWDWAQNMSEAAKEQTIDALTDELPVGIAAPNSATSELPVGIAAPTPAGGSDCNRADAPLFCVSRAGEGQP